MTNSNPVLHIDFLTLKPDATPAAVEALLVEAAGLLTIGNVLAGGAIRGETGSDFDLGVYFLLASFMDLEPFGTDLSYARFLQTGVAPLLRSFDGASVSLQAPFPSHDGYAACLALAAPEETYDWEVRTALAEWPGADDASVVGLAIGERQRYRGCVMSFSNAPILPRRIEGARFQTSVIAGRSLAFE